MAKHHFSLPSARQRCVRIVHDVGLVHCAYFTPREAVACEAVKSYPFDTFKFDLFTNGRMTKCHSFFHSESPRPSLCLNEFLRLYSPSVDSRRANSVEAMVCFVCRQQQSTTNAALFVLFPPAPNDLNFHFPCHLRIVMRDGTPVCAVDILCSAETST